LPILVRRGRGGYALLRSLKLTLDGVEVGRVRPGSEVRFSGTGDLQRLCASVDWASSNELEIRDPGSDSTLVLDVEARPFWSAAWRGLVAPKTTYILKIADRDVS
jgi:hypothetical protein